MKVRWLVVAAVVLAASATAAADSAAVVAAMNDAGAACRYLQTLMKNMDQDACVKTFSTTYGLDALRSLVKIAELVGCRTRADLGEHRNLVDALEVADAKFPHFRCQGITDNEPTPPTTERKRK